MLLCLTDVSHSFNSITAFQFSKPSDSATVPTQAADVSLPSQQNLPENAPKQSRNRPLIDPKTDSKIGTLLQPGE